MNNHNHAYQTHDVTTPAEPLLPLTKNEGREHPLTAARKRGSQPRAFMQTRRGHALSATPYSCGCQMNASGHKIP